MSIYLTANLIIFLSGAHRELQYELRDYRLVPETPVQHSVTRPRRFMAGSSKVGFMYLLSFPRHSNVQVTCNRMNLFVAIGWMYTPVGHTQL